MREPTHGHGLSPAMLRLLREMDAQERPGFVLTRQYARWWWVCGATQLRAPGIRTDTVYATQRRGCVKHEPAAPLFPNRYRLTLAGQRAVEAMEERDDLLQPH